MRLDYVVDASSLVRALKGAKASATGRASNTVAHYEVLNAFGKRPTCYAGLASNKRPH